MTKARSNATAEAAKGDLRAGTGTNLSGILAVGNNGETIVADNSTSTGLRWQAPVQANPVINSNFSVWQRGTSVAIPSGYVYSADRWIGYTSSVAGGYTVSRQATNDTTNLPFIQYCARVQRDSGSTNTGQKNFGQFFESVNSIPYAGKTVTLSFYARAGANFSATSNNLTYQIVTGTGTDQNNYSGSYTGAAFPINTAATLTTTWQRFSASVTLASTITELGLSFVYVPTGTAGAADYYEITGIQLEVGSVATPYKPTGATIQGELAACQRYYYRTGGQAYSTFSVSAFPSSSTAAYAVIPFPVSLRTAYSSIDYGGSIALADGANSAAVTSITSSNNSTQTGFVAVNVASGLTVYRTCYMYANNSATAYLGFNAEL